MAAAETGARIPVGAWYAPVSAGARVRGIGASTAKGQPVSDKPNVLIIWGDDIGQSNLSCYSNGLMGYRTPNIDRVAAEGVLFTDYYARAELHRRTGGVHHRPEPVPHRPDQGGHARGAAGPAGAGPDDRDGAQGAGLRHRAVRQEPPRRPRRAPAHDARLRRVLRQPVSPQRRRGTRTAGLSEGSGVPQEVRAARRAAHLGQRRRHPAHRGHRPAHQEADGNLRRRIPRRRSRFHQAPARSRNSVLRVVQHHAHAFPHPHQARERGPRRALAVALPRHDARSRRHGRRHAGSARRAGHRREHDRHVLHRQRSPHEQLARRRHDPVPQREELQLGGRLPRPGDGALAGAHPGRLGAERHRQPRRLVRHAACRRRACPTSPSGCARAQT